jgi:hypothetical protein
VRWLGAAVVCGAVLSNVALLSHVSSWRDAGWAGRDAPEIDATDAIARRMQSNGPAEASVGYQVDFWRFMADVNRVDPRYKVGADIDLLLRYRHRITNLDRCAEGFRPGDDYRIVQVARKPATDNHGLNRLSPPGDAPSAFAILWRADLYEVRERR